MAIKIKIDNQEVLSNKEFTIKEEMLNTSSTILEKCFPKEWDDDKDYSSRFYYPKDYSKCIIGEGEFLHGTDHYATLETTGTFETNVEKKVQGLYVEGNSYQETRSGKNIFELVNAAGTQNVNSYEITATGYSVNTNDRVTSSIYARLYFDTRNFPTGIYHLSLDVTVPITCEVAIGWSSNNNYLTQLIEANKKTHLEIVGEIGSYLTLACFGANIKAIFEKVMISKDGGEYEPYGVMPSPDYPSEIENVRGIENLVDISQGFRNGYLNTTTGAFVSENVSFVLNYYIPVIGGNKYTYLLNENISNMSIYSFDKNKTYIKRERIVYSNNIITINISDNAKYIVLGGNYNGRTKVTQEILNNLNVMFNNGEIFDYLPYGSNYLPLKITGKNLFDKEKATNGMLVSRIDGILRENTRFSTSDFIRVKPNTDYYTYGFDYWYACCFDENKNYLGYMENKRVLHTLSSAKYIRIGLFTTNLDTAYIIEGTQPIEYEPYRENTSLINLQNNELCKIGDIKDELNIDSNGNVKLIKRIGKKVLDGSEPGIGISQRSLGTQFDIPNTLGKVGDNNVISMLSDRFRANKFNDRDKFVNGIYAWSGDNRIRILTNVASNLNDFKTWLSNNKPIVYYVLENEEVIELGNVDLPNVQVGINNFSLYTGLETNYKLYYLWENYKLLFAGVVENTGNISLRPTDPKYCSLQILDFKTFLSEGETLDYVINNKTIREAIEMVIGSCADYGVVVGNINILNEDDVIGAYSTLDKTPFDVLQYLADISQSRWTTRLVDENMIAVDFYDPTLMPRGENIQYTEKWFSDNNINNLSFNYSSRDYRNKQVMTSNKVFADIDYTETIISNGYNASYMLSQEVGKIIEISINGTQKTFTSRENKDIGVTADFYYSVESQELTSDDVLSAGTPLRVVYTPFVEGRQVIRNQNEIDRIKNNLDIRGVVSRYEERNDAVTSEELYKIGQSYIKYKGSPEINLTIKTQNNIWNVGEIVMFNAPLEELTTEYMVKSKEINYITSINKIFFTYVLSSSFNSETEINYFDNQRNKSKGNLKEGQTINRNIDIESETTIIFDNLKIEQIGYEGDNILNSTLNSPFVE